MKVDESPLYEITSQLHLRPQALQADAGGLLVTVRGGRVLGVYLDREDDNLLWTHPALGELASAKSFVEAGEWNLGGDRCWLAPELELHFLDAENPSHDNYIVPTKIDPGQYAIASRFATGITFATRGDARNARTGGKFAFQIARSIALCEPPIETRELRYVGYELASELVVDSPDRPEACYGLWQLMQLPSGGVLSIATHGKPALVDYFATGVDSHCRCAAGSVTFPITAQAQHKIGLAARDVTGRVSYLRPLDDDRGTLIVRQASIFPGAVYADYPAHQPQRRDIAIQAYNDAGSLGTFGEMEYHAPAACAANNFRTYDVSRTWCFGGSLARLRAVESELLGITLGRS
jgi:hypothetical protein